MAWNNRYSRPDPNKVYVESFQNLTGGINRFDLDYRLKGNESPFMQNLSWHNGTLTSRLGQVRQGFAHASRTCAPFLYHGWMLGAYRLRDGGTWVYKVQLTGESEAEQAVGSNLAWPGTSGSDTDPTGIFVRYREDVFYKVRGAYYRFSWDKETDTISRESLTDWFNRDVYVPVIQMDSDPEYGSGIKYEEENRLSPYKTVWYNPKAGFSAYKLPVDEVELVSKVEVDGRELYANEYSFDQQTSTVTFVTEPTGGQNSVAITYKKSNPQALKNLQDCTTMAVFGGTQELCIVLGCSEEQPNAYYWSGLGRGDAMDPTYFPMNQYNLVGDNDDPITAMGKQQNMLVIFQGSSTGRAVFGTETINGFDQITMNYTRINAEIGCDLPGSLQLVENNLVWCSRKYGVCRLKDSSAAYENNIVQISRKINGDYRLDGLLEQLKSVADDAVKSTDTGKRYILVLGDEDGKAYEWNYELSQPDNPSWFFHTNILGVGFVPLANEELYEVTADGKVCTFEPVFKDFDDTPINKIYRFPPRDFGSYDRLKNIKSILVTTRSDAKTNTQLKYTCDYAERVDPTNLVVILNRLLYAAVFRRKPGYHNIHHLGIELSNNVAGDDLNIVSAQIFYEYRGRTR